MNAFTVRSQIEKRKISREYPYLYDAEVSAEFEKRWKMMKDEERQPYILEAERGPILHLQQPFIEEMYRKLQQQNESLRMLELQHRDLTEKLRVYGGKICKEITFDLIPLINSVNP